MCVMSFLSLFFFFPFHSPSFSLCTALPFAGSLALCTNLKDMKKIGKVSMYMVNLSVLKVQRTKRACSGKSSVFNVTM